MTGARGHAIVRHCGWLGPFSADRPAPPTPRESPDALEGKSVTELEKNVAGPAVDGTMSTETGVPAPSYFAQIGGAEAVKAAVGIFYDRVLADPELAGYFTEVEMVEQRRHLVLMLTAVLGGPDNYRGRTLAEAHQPLHIPPAHYALVGAHLVATLTELGVPAEILGHVQGVLGQVEDQVVAAGHGTGV